MRERNRTIAFIPEGLGYVEDDPSVIRAIDANTSEENRIKYVTDLASISRGKTESANPPTRYRQLLKEAAPNELSNGNETPSRPLEFLPVICSIVYVLDRVTIYLKKCPIVMSIEDFNNRIMKYSYIKYHTDKDNGIKVYKLYTNMRALLNAGIEYDNIPYNTREEFLDSNNKPIFKAIKIKAPMFVFNHLVTHTQLSKEARSERVVELNSDNYWIPQDLFDRYVKIVKDPDHKDYIELVIYGGTMYSGDYSPTKNKHDNNAIIQGLLRDHSQKAVAKLLKILGYKREIYQRAMLEFRFKEWLMVGYTINPDTWEHLFLERGAKPEEHKNWTQHETKLTVQTIRSLF